MEWTQVLGTWVAALLTLSVYSFLYKDNPAYKFAEHVFIGVSAGYSLCIAWHNVIKQDVIDRLANGQWFVLVPVALGFLMYARFSRKYGWVSRIPMSFVVGVGAGIGVPNVVQATLIRHIQSTITPIISPNGVAWNDICILVGVVCVLIYFFFSVEHKGVIKWASYVGVLYLMVYFGASFGYTVMARISLIIGRMRFLIVDWIYPTFDSVKSLFGS